jgi:hypothetical protein
MPAIQQGWTKGDKGQRETNTRLHPHLDKGF